MTHEDENLVESAYRKYYHKLYLHACSILGQCPEAEVAVQEAFLDACRKIGDFLSSNSQIGWLKKAVEYEALHILREQKYTAALFLSIEELSPVQEPVALDSTSFELTDFCRGAVSKEELDFFLRIAKRELSFQEEAEKQGIGLAACYKRFERIRKKLQLALEEFHKI